MPVINLGLIFTILQSLGSVLQIAFSIGTSLFGFFEAFIGPFSPAP